MLPHRAAMFQRRLSRFGTNLGCRIDLRTLARLGANQGWRTIPTVSQPAAARRKYT